MTKDKLKAFVNLRQSLMAERESLRKRLREVEAALGGNDVKRTAPSKGAETGAKRLKNPMSLRAAMAKVTSDSPKTKKEILEGVKKLGYRFGGANPMNSINVVLYSKPKFRNQEGKFSPGK